MKAMRRAIMAKISRRCKLTATTITIQGRKESRGRDRIAWDNHRERPLMRPVSPLICMKNRQLSTIQKRRDKRLINSNKRLLRIRPIRKMLPYQKFSLWTWRRSKLLKNWPKSHSSGNQYLSIRDRILSLHRRTRWPRRARRHLLVVMARTRDVKIHSSFAISFLIYWARRATRAPNRELASAKLSISSQLQWTPQRTINRCNSPIQLFPWWPRKRSAVCLSQCKTTRRMLVSQICPHWSKNWAVAAS